MAPNFLSKFVKSSSDHHRSRTNSSARSSTSFITSSTPSSIVAKPAIAVQPAPPGTRQSGYSSDSSSPNVTVIPPSPHTSDVSLFDRSSDRSVNGTPTSNQPSSSTARRVHSLSVGHAPRSPTPTTTTPTPTTETQDEDPMTPTPWNLTSPSDRSNAVRPSSSTGNLRAQNPEQSPMTRSHTVAVPTVQLDQSGKRDRTISQKSSRSALKVKVDNIISAVTRDEKTAVPPPLTVSPSELVSSPEPHPDSATASITISPIVDSPTNMSNPGSDFGSPLKSHITPSATMPNIPSSSLLGLPDQSDAASVYSVGGTKKRRPWGRSSKEKEPTAPTLSTSSTFSSITSTSPKSKRKPTAAGGLASALAASGLAMANPAAVMQPIIATEPPKANRSNSTISNPKSATSPSSHKRRSSNDRNPKTPPSRTTRSRQTSISYATSDVSDRVSFYSGDDGDDMVSGSEDDSDDLDLDADIPVTGFAVASARRNQEFHDMFGSIPEGDYLIEGMYEFSKISARNS